MRGDLHYTLTTVDNVLTSLVAVRSCELAPRFNIAPGQQAPVAIMRDGARVIEHMRWGLLPRWRGHGGKRGPLVNAAPVEAVPATPLLRDAFRHQRCLIVADGCYAWNALKQPVWFHPEPCRTIGFAGVWATNKDDDTPSFALLLGEPLVTRVSEPMPIVIDDAHYDAWLTAAPDAALALCAARALDGWRADPVTTWMASADHDDPKCIEPIGNPRQGELF